MTVAFSDIEVKFGRVFGFIQSNLERFLAQDAGGNFAVAALAACACETLARYRYGSGEGGDVFCRLLSDGPFQVGVSADHVHGCGRVNVQHSERWACNARQNRERWRLHNPARLAALHRTHGQGLLLLWDDLMGSLREKYHGASVLAELERLRVA